MTENLHITAEFENDKLLVDKKSRRANLAFGQLALICLAGSIIFKSCNMFCIFIGISFISLNQRCDYITKTIAVIFLFVINYFLYLQLNSFEFFPQAYALLEINPSLVYWFENGHMHAIRLMIAYPGYIFQNLFGLELNVAFSYYCTIIFTLLFIKLMNIKDYFSKKKGMLDIVGICLFFVFVMILFFIMNGRICFAFLGFSVLIYEMVVLYNEANPQNWLLRYLKVMIGIILSTVSSGTMAVSCGFVGIMFIMRIIKQKKIEKGAIRLISVCVVGSPVLFFAIKYVIKMINKNLIFFGGGFDGAINMLQHGIGRIFGTPSDTMVLWILSMGCVVLAVNICVLLYLYRKFQQKFPLLIATNISFYGSFFGFSTGSLILVPLSVITAILCDRFYSKCFKAVMIRKIEIANDSEV